MLYIPFASGNPLFEDNASYRVWFHLELRPEKDRSRDKESQREREREGTSEKDGQRQRQTELPR